MAARFKVEIGFTAPGNTFIINSSLLGGTDVLGGQAGKAWVDVTQWVIAGSVTVSRGSSRSQGPWWRAEAGHVSFTLDNNDGSDRFNPLNLSGPYAAAGVSQCRPNIPVRVSVDDGMGTGGVPLIFGFVDHWTPVLDGDRWSTMQISATDGTGRLQRANLGALSSESYAGDLGPARIGRLLDRGGWDVNARILSTKTDGATMQATTMAQPVWSEMLLTADSDGALVFQDCLGNIRYMMRSDFPTGPQYTFDATSTSSYSFASADVSFDDEQVFNIIKLARAGGVEQYTEDATSTSTDVNGPRGYARSDLICETDADVAGLAGWLLYQFKDLKFRVEAITVELVSEDTTSTWNAIGAIDLGHRVRVRYPTPSSSTNTTYSNVIDVQGIVRGLSWSEFTGGARCVISLQTVPTAGSPFIIGSSLLGGTAVLTPY